MLNLHRLKSLLVVLAASCATPTPFDQPVVRSVTVAEGVQLRVLEAGARTRATPIVMVPGWSTGADIWGSQIAHFASGRRVISFDPRSQVHSTLTAAGNTPEQRAQDLHALLAAVRLPRPPVIVAWSQGVQDLAAYVQRYGTGDIAGIVFVDAAVSQGSVAAPDVAAQQARMMDIYRANQREYLTGMMAAIISAPQPAGFIEQLIDTGMMTPPAIGVEMLNADLNGVDRTPALARIDKPTLIVASAASAELDQQRTMAASIVGARLVVIADASHAVFLDQPDRFDAIVDAFLDQIDR